MAIPILVIISPFSPTYLPFLKPGLCTLHLAKLWEAFTWWGALERCSKYGLLILTCHKRNEQIYQILSNKLSAEPYYPRIRYPRSDAVFQNPLYWGCRTPDIVIASRYPACRSL